MPDGITKLGRQAFESTPWLEGCKEKGEEVIVGKVLVLGPKNATGEYVIPDGVTSICDNAFEGCIGLTGITIPKSVTEIG